MRKSSGDSTREFRGRRVSGFTADGYREVMSRYMRRQWAPRRDAAKMLSRITGASPRTAENWLDGSCAPQGHNLLALMQECRELRAEILALVEG